jgi:hypothetical protein
MCGQLFDSEVAFETREGLCVSILRKGQAILEAPVEILGTHAPLPALGTHAPLHGTLPADPGGGAAAGGGGVRVLEGSSRSCSFVCMPLRAHL